MGTTEPTGRDLISGFAAMIKTAREELGWSCARLGEVAGVSGNTVSAIEREIRAPSLRVAAALATALGIKAWLHDPATPVTSPVEEEPEPRKSAAKKGKK